MKTRAAVLQAIGRPQPYAESRPLVVEELVLDAPGAGEVLVKIKAAGLCHSDLSVINGDRPRPTPMALGHEAAGIVSEVGPGVDDLEPGDHVVHGVRAELRALPAVHRRAGRRCASPAPRRMPPATLLSGAKSLQRKRRAGEPSHRRLGVRRVRVVSRATRSSGSTRTCRSRRRRCSAARCSPAWARWSTPRGAVPGATVAVIGLGGVGLERAARRGRLAGAAARSSRSTSPTTSSTLARKLGATDTFNARATRLVEAVRAATAGGVDVAFELAGSVKAMELACRSPAAAARR